MEKVAVNKFVRRQVKGSGKTYSDSLSFEEISEDAANQMADGQFKEGYREGVRIVMGRAVLASKFVCPFVKIEENTELVAKLVRRRPEEKPYIQTRAKSGTPLKAGRIEYILYRHDVLAENDEQSTDAEWELVSIHAIPEGVDKLPMGPVTMMRNQLELKGGTKAHYSSEEWAEAVKFWQEYAALDD
ncbi:MAG: DUF3228 family protein [Candidatus Marinimicrobia bacterium]|nr:DUF3228 family protein [Candidatus Neomarinimicrobiota bacterium]